jgi:hypothetical protein
MILCPFGILYGHSVNCSETLVHVTEIGCTFSRFGTLRQEEKIWQPRHKEGNAKMRVGAAHRARNRKFWSRARARRKPKRKTQNANVT